MQVRIQRRVGEHPNIVYMKELVETPDRSSLPTLNSLNFMPLSVWRHPTAPFSKLFKGSNLD